MARRQLKTWSFKWPQITLTCLLGPGTTFDTTDVKIKKKKISLHPNKHSSWFFTLFIQRIMHNIEVYNICYAYVYVYSLTYIIYIYYIIILSWYNFISKRTPTMLQVFLFYLSNITPSKKVGHDWMISVPNFLFR